MIDNKSRFILQKASAADAMRRIESRKAVDVTSYAVHYDSPAVVHMQWSDYDGELRFSRYAADVEFEDFCVMADLAQSIGHDDAGVMAHVLLGLTESLARGRRA